MKTVIVYASKRGSTREIAERIASFLVADLVDLSKNATPNLSAYDSVIVGGSIYAGTVHKLVKQFVASYKDELSSKTLGIFVGGMSDKEVDAYFETNFPEALLKHAKATAFLGGVFDPKTSGVVLRFIMKVALKQTEYLNTIDSGKIKQFVDEMEA